MIYGIHGKIGAGKDTVAKIIQELQPERDWVVKKFAGKIKLIASILSGIPQEKFEDQDFKKQNMPEQWDRTISFTDHATGQHYPDYKKIRMTYRELLQKLGTEAMRDGLHKNVWVNALWADYRLEKTGEQYPEYGIIDSGDRIPLGMNHFVEYPNWLITDMRFPNEAQSVLDHDGKLITVRRPGESTGTHESEAALDNWDKWDHVIINDGSLEQLREKVKNVLSLQQ